MVERYNGWGDDLSCGHVKIDADHRDIFELAEKFRKLVRQGESKTLINHSASKLIDRIATHFAEEEALMVTLAYPELSDHKLEHSLFLESVQGFKQSFDCESYSSHKGLWQFLRRWFLHHIFYADTQLAAFILQAKSNK